MSRPDLDALRAYLAAGSRLPFEHSDDSPYRPADSKLIVAAVNALPELIAWIEELQEDNRDLADALVSMLRE